MHIEVNGKEKELVFGFKFLQELNNAFPTVKDGQRIDAGVINSQVALQTADPLGITKIIKCALSHHKTRPTNEEVYNGLDKLLADEYKDDMDKLISDIKKAMGKHSMVRASLKRLEKNMEAYQAKQQAAQAVLTED